MKKLIALLIAMMLLCSVAVAESVDATSGASQVTTPETQMAQEDIKTMILDYLRGFPLTKNEDGTTKEWAYREMYQIATVHGDMPGLSSVEFVLDPETMRLYCSSEKDLITLQYKLKQVLDTANSMTGDSVTMDAAASVATEGSGRVTTQTIRAAMTVISVVPIACVYPFLQKYFVKGMTLGAVKG